MRHLVFVYGTLKEGFCNFGVNTGARVAGEYVTAEPYPLYLVGPRRLPWLVDAPGEGHPVVGQLFEVDAEGLARMDALERTGEPGWYRRGRVRVRPRDDASAAPVGAMVYFGDPAVPGTETVHLGPIAEYTAAHDAAYGEP